jgi:hypothetical protein
VQFAITRVAVPRRANGPDPEPPRSGRPTRRREGNKRWGRAARTTPAGPFRRAAGNRRVRAAHIGNVDDSDQAFVADDWQVPEVAARHDLGRVTDASRGVDDGRASGHQGMDPGTVHVLSVGDRVGNVRLGDDA